MNWLSQNWFNLAQTLGIILSVLFSGYAYWLAVRGQRVTNTFQMMQFHREIWKSLFEYPELSRVLKDDAEVEKKPITDSERLFVTLLILHLSSVYSATKHKAIEPVEGLELDIHRFF